MKKQSIKQIKNIVERAIKAGANIIFHYTDLNNNMTFDREIKPANIIFFREELRVKGFCFLRDDNREFYFRSMKAVQRVKPQKKQNTRLHILRSINTDERLAA